MIFTGDFGGGAQGDSVPAMLRGIYHDPALSAVLEQGECIRWHSQPNAGSLFLSIVPALVRDVVFLTVLGFGLYANRNHAATANLLLSGAVVLLLVWLLVRNLREGTAAGVSHYLVTDRRIVLLTPRADPQRFVILPWMPETEEERHRLSWLDGKPLAGRIADGRATIRIGYQIYRSRTINNYPAMAYRRQIVRLYGVAEPHEAIAAILQLRRDRTPMSHDDDRED